MSAMISLKARFTMLIIGIIFSDNEYLTFIYLFEKDKSDRILKKNWEWEKNPVEPNRIYEEIINYGEHFDTIFFTLGISFNSETISQYMNSFKNYKNGERFKIETFETNNKLLNQLFDKSSFSLAFFDMSNIKLFHSLIKNESVNFNYKKEFDAFGVSVYEYLKEKAIAHLFINRNDFKENFKDEVMDFVCSKSKNDFEFKLRNDEVYKIKFEADEISKLSNSFSQIDKKIENFFLNKSTEIIYFKGNNFYIENVLEKKSRDISNFEKFIDYISNFIYLLRERILSENKLITDSKTISENELRNLYNNYEKNYNELINFKNLTFEESEFVKKLREKLSSVNLEQQVADPEHRIKPVPLTPPPQTNNTINKPKKGKKELIIIASIVALFILIFVFFIYYKQNGSNTSNYPENLCESYEATSNLTIYKILNIKKKKKKNDVIFYSSQIVILSQEINDTIDATITYNKIEGSVDVETNEQKEWADFFNTGNISDNKHEKIIIFNDLKFSGK